MGDIRLTIDGREVQAEEGTTIFEAARKAGIHIPHLCYRHDLTPTTSCRLCVVEVEGARTLVASCALPAAPKMVVRTGTKRVQDARKLVVELLLSDHPYDCMTCEKSGSCKLEKYAYEFGIRKARFLGEKHEYSLRAANPFYERDYNKCILCGRCVTVCQEIQYCEAVDYSKRGFTTKVAASFDHSMQESPCVFCGNCVSVCPVGALSEKAGRFQGRDWELKKIPTVCSYCGVGCTLVLNVKDNQVLKVTSDKDLGVNKGWTCVKGRFGFDYIHSPDRLTEPLIREGEKFRPASWDEALNRVAEGLKKVKADHGPEAIGILVSAKCTNEENYLLQKLARVALSTNNVDHCARLWHSSTVAGLAMAFGSGAMTNTIGEIRDADCIFVIGSNTTENHPVIALEVKAAVRQKGAKLIVADPRRIELVDDAHLWLGQKPGTDVALINGMLQAIISRGWYNKAFVEERTEGFKALAESVKEYTPDAVEAITGVPAKDIEEAARLYAQSPNSTILYAMGITQHVTGTNNVLALANLAMVAGQIGKPSSGVNPLRGQNNVQGACDMGGLPNVYTGYQRVDDRAVQQKFEKAWGVSLSPHPGLTLMEMMKGIAEGKLKALFILGENPLLSDPNANKVKDELKHLDLLVVQDIFLSETAELAQVVLPGVSFAEKDGTFTNTERRVQRVRKAIEPLGNARPDWQIICDLSSRLGYPMNYGSPKESMEEIASLTPSYGGIRYERLEGLGLQWPCPTADHPGTPFLHKEKFTRGKGKFHVTPYAPAPELPDEEYPYLLTTGRVLYHYHTMISRKSRGLSEIYPEGVVEINPEDAVRLGIQPDNGLVEVASRRGKVKVKAKVADNLPPGVVFMTFHFKEAAANLLTIDALDPVAKIPGYKVCAVKIQKL